MGVAGAGRAPQPHQEKQDLQGYRERHWTGTLADYMEIVMANPKVARNAYQRLYDMILSHGVTEYTRHHERYAHYRLFDDPIDGGRDAVFGLDAPLMRLVHNVKSAAFGYGTEKRILLLHGPVGSSKSTIARLLKKGLEVYSNQQEGALYTFGWKPDLAATGHERRAVVPDARGPAAPHPAGEPGGGLRRDQPAAGPAGTTASSPTGNLCPFCRKTYQDLMTQYEGNWEQLIRHVVVKRLILSEKDRVGIGTFQPKDEKNQDSTELTGDLNYRKIAEYGIRLRPPRLQLRRRAQHRQPRDHRVHRDPEAGRGLPLRPAGRLPGAQDQAQEVPADRHRRGHRRATPTSRSTASSRTTS